MSFSLAITIQDNATPFLVTVQRGAMPGQAMNQYIADAATVATQRQFLYMARTNQGVLGHSGFWQRMNAGTIAVATPDAAIVRMPREVAQRFYGGTITPKKGTYLAIPMRSEAYGKSPRQFNDLRFIPPTDHSPAMLVQRDQTKLTKSRRRKDGSQTIHAHEEGGGAFFMLVKSVTQRGNSDVLPTQAEFAEAARKGFNAYLRSMRRAA